MHFKSPFDPSRLRIPHTGSDQVSANPVTLVSTTPWMFCCYTVLALLSRLNFTTSSHGFCLLHRQASFRHYSNYFLTHTLQSFGRLSTISASQASDTATAQEASAVQTTLATLSWPALCEFVARFASTTMGRQAVQRLPLSEDQEQSEKLVKETAAVDKLEAEYAVELDFGGTSTSQVRLAYKLYSGLSSPNGKRTKEAQQPM